MTIDRVTKVAMVVIGIGLVIAFLLGGCAGYLLA